MYSKHDTRNRTVFSEFLIFDLSWLTRGGTYLFLQLAMGKDDGGSKVGSAHHDCFLTATYTAVCTSIQMTIWPSNGMSTLRETRSAVGLFRDRTGYGPAQLTTILISVSFNGPELDS